MSAVTLYYFPSSFYSQKVSLVLEEKKIPTKRVFINLPGGETSSPWYLTNVNSMGQVPTIQHGVNYISNSNEIIRYLDKTFDGEPIFPNASTFKGKKIDEFLKLHEFVHVEVLTYGALVHPGMTEDSNVSAAFQQSGADSITKRIRSKEHKENMNKHPELRDIYARKAEDAEEFENNCLNSDNVMQCITDCKTFFDRVEEILQSNADEGNAHYFLHDEDFNMADVTLAISLQRTIFIGLATCTWRDGKHPNIEKYHTRLLSRPSFQEVCIKGYDTASISRQMFVSVVKSSAKKVAIFCTFAAAAYFVYTHYKNV